MPHTSRKNRNSRAYNKRVKVTDDDGWTHVASTRIARTSRNTKGDAGDGKPQLLPAEAPARLTLSGLQKQYDSHCQQWQSSATWESLQRTLHDQAGTSVKKIDNVVCIGLGSPSGLVRGGWVDRRSVAMYQLAALVSILDFLARSGKDSPIRHVYAQDPVFNDLDRQLLQFHGITVIDHPAVFDQVNACTFCYCPGTERSHMERILTTALPAFVFGGPLESVVPSLDNQNNPDDGGDILTTFVKTRQSSRLPRFEPNEHAFWDMRLYWEEEGERNESKD